MASENPNAIHLLEMNQEKIDWNVVSKIRLDIFEYDYQNMKTKFLSTIGKELIEWQFHPKNQEKWKGWEIYC
jgi:hypothetical protein